MDEGWAKLKLQIEKSGSYLQVYNALVADSSETEALRSVLRLKAMYSAELIASLSPEEVQRETVRHWLGGNWGEPEWTSDQLCELVRLAHIHPEAYWVARREAANRHLNGNPMPRIFVHFAMSVLYGDFPEPKPHGRPVAADDWKLALLYLSTKAIICPPHLHRFRNEVSDHQDTACDYMSEALAEFGKNIDPSYINDLFKKGQYEPIRLLADRVKPPVQSEPKTN